MDVFWSFIAIGILIAVEWYLIIFGRVEKHHKR